MQKTGYNLEVLKRLLALTFCFGWIGMANGQQYDLPFKSEDLEPGERILWDRDVHSAGGVQQFGYDLDVARYNKSTQTWEMQSGDKNSDYYIYDKRIYAMRSGKIIACWRNAPENPNPHALHPETGVENIDKGEQDIPMNTRIYGGGNGMWIEHSDGSRAEYAHFRPATVPSALCPHQTMLLPNSIANPDVTVAWPQIRVPSQQQIEVQAGQFLGRAGNAGTGSRPHLHIHVESGGTADMIKSGGSPERINFRRGLYAPKSAKGIDTNWIDFAGKPIPDGKVLVWPPLSQRAEYTRYGITLKNHGHLHTWLSASGFWPEYTDIYTVAGKPYINATWRPAKSQWLAFHKISASVHQSTYDDARKKGYSLAQIDSTIINGKVYYMSFYVKDGVNDLAGHGMNLAQFNGLQSRSKEIGYKPASVSVVLNGNFLSYTALYRPDGSSNWHIEPLIEIDHYQSVYDYQAKQGRHPVYVNSYRVKNKRYFSVIFADRNNSGIDRTRMTKTGVASILAQGLKTGTISGYDGATAEHRFIGYWR